MPRKTSAEPKTAPLAVKVLADSGDTFTIGGYGVVWGGQDLTGDYFTAKTDFWFDRLTETPPVLYQHGQDSTLKRTVVGRITSKRSDEFGLWVEAQITAAKEYADAIRELVGKGVLGFSSGAVAHLVERTKSAKAGLAEIVSWPIAELSLTPTPAEPRTVGVKELKAMAASLIELRPIADAAEKAMDAAERNKLADSDFAYVDSEGGRHLPIHDEAHVRAALGGDGFPKQKFENDAARRKAARKIMRAAQREGIEVSKDSEVAQAAGVSASKDLSFEDIRQQISALLNPPRLLPNQGPMPWSYVLETFADYVIVKTEDATGDVDTFKIPYTIGDPDGDGDEDVVLGTPVEVESVYVPVGKGEKKARSLPGQPRHELAELKRGRSMSQRNLDQVHQAMSVLGAMHGSTCDMGESCPMKDVRDSANTDPDDGDAPETKITELDRYRLGFDDFSPYTPALKEGSK